MSRRGFLLLVLLASGSVLTAIAIATPMPRRIPHLFRRTEPAPASLMPLTAHSDAQNPKP
jgi:hypothetical protein